LEKLLENENTYMVPIFTLYLFYYGLKRTFLLGTWNFHQIHEHNIICYNFIGTINVRWKFTNNEGADFPRQAMFKAVNFFQKYNSMFGIRVILYNNYIL